MEIATGMGGSCHSVSCACVNERMGVSELGCVRVRACVRVFTRMQIYHTIHSLSQSGQTLENQFASCNTQVL